MESAKYKRLLVFLFLILLFPLLYFEDRVFFGSLSLSNLWRMLLLAFLVLRVIASANRAVHKALWVFLLFPLSLLFISRLPGIKHIEEVAVALVFPLVAIVVASSVIKRQDKISFIIYLSGFLIVTTVPYLFGFLEPVELEINETLDNFSNLYGLENRMFVGVFKHPSFAGKTLALCTVVVWQHYRTERKWVFLLLSILGAYGVFASFTRTGWVLLVIGVFIVEWRKKNTWVVFWSLLVFLAFLVKGSDSVITNRILGAREVYAEKRFIDVITNGRASLFQDAIAFFGDLSFYECLVGVGKDYADQQTGVAHNRFLEILLYGGLKSVFVLVNMIWLLYKRSTQMAEQRTGFLGVGVALLVVSLIPSHGFPFWGDVLLGIIVGVEYEKHTNIQEAL